MYGHQSSCTAMIPRSSSTAPYNHFPGTCSGKKSTGEKAHTIINITGSIYGISFSKQVNNSCLTEIPWQSVTVMRSILLPSAVRINSSRWKYPVGPGFGVSNGCTAIPERLACVMPPRTVRRRRRTEQEATVTRGNRVPTVSLRRDFEREDCRSPRLSIRGLFPLHYFRLKQTAKQKPRTCSRPTMCTPWYRRGYRNFPGAILGGCTPGLQGRQGLFGSPRSCVGSSTRRRPPRDLG